MTCRERRKLHQLAYRRDYLRDKRIPGLEAQEPVDRRALEGSRAELAALDWAIEIITDKLGAGVTPESARGD